MAQEHEQKEVPSGIPFTSLASRTRRTFSDTDSASEYDSSLPQSPPISGFTEEERRANAEAVDELDAALTMAASMAQKDADAVVIDAMRRALSADVRSAELEDLLATDMVTRVNTNTARTLLPLFAKLTRKGSYLSPFDNNKEGLADLLIAFLKPQNNPAITHAISILQSILNDQNTALFPASSLDRLLATISDVLADHCLRSPSLAFSKRCLFNIELLLNLEITIMAGKKLPLTTTYLSENSISKVLAALCLFFGLESSSDFDNDIDAHYSVKKVIKSLTQSYSQKIINRSLLDLCNILNSGFDEQLLGLIFPNLDAVQINEERNILLAKSGALKALDFICFDPKPILESFTMTRIRRIVLQSFISAATLSGKYSGSPEHSDICGKALNLICTWTQNTVLLWGDWEDILQLLVSLKPYITDASFTVSSYIRESYLQICTNMYTKYRIPPSQTSHESCLTLLFSLFAETTNSDDDFGFSDEILMSIVDFVAWSEGWTPHSVSEKVRILMARFFQWSKNTSALQLQECIIDNALRILECKDEYDTEEVCDIAVDLVQLIKACSTKENSSLFDPKIAEKIIETTVYISRGCNDATLQKLVTFLQAGCVFADETIALLCTKNLVKLFRTCIIERQCKGCDYVYLAISEIAGNENDIVHETVKIACFKFLLSVRVSGGDKYGGYHLGVTWTESFTAWLGFKGEIKLSSSKLRAKVAETSNSGSSDFRIISDGIYIDLNPFFSSIFKTFQSKSSWELYSLVLYGFETQLQNISAYPQVISHTHVETLRAHCCSVVEFGTAAAFVDDLPSNVKKSDLYSIIFKCLASLVIWSARPSTGRYCVQCLINFLTELPFAMTRLLPDTLMKISRVTSSQMAPHILEFLSTLARLPEIYINLTEADYKRIFGIALQYIHSPPPLSAAAGSDPVMALSNLISQYAAQLAYHVISVWFVNMQLSDRKRYVPFIIGSILTQAPSATNSEASSLFDESVELVMDMLVQNSYADCIGKPDTFTNTPSVVNKEADGMATGLPFISAATTGTDSLERCWIQGNSVVSMRNLKMSGWVEVVIRRPSGVIVFSLKLENRARFLEEGVDSGGSSEVQIASVIEKAVEEISDGAKSSTNSPTNLLEELVSFDAELKQNEMKNMTSSLSRSTDFHIKTSHSIKSLIDNSAIKNLPLDPSFVLLQLTTFPQQSNIPPCIPIPTSEEAFARAIKIIDMTPVSDLHKIGVLYIGVSQTHERQILQNESGSPEYTRFICSLGKMVPLRGLERLHTGGLDTSEAVIDGKACVAWQDAASGNQIIFHITTLMPTNVETDPGCNLKKRHVGNDFVSILFDESGTTDIGFDTIPGQFNFINIFVTPVVINSRVDENNRSGANDRFHVIMKTKPELNLPPLGVFSEGFLVAGDNLPGVVRRAAIHANMLALVVARSRAGGFRSNARERLIQIKRLTERVKKNSTAVAASDGTDREALLNFTRFL
ncbi:Tuberous sclerosis 2-like protein [Physocladia obscura]|uniref:Tuberous sclerosis 2-like protein n=1 Tax=Physocladia obscura TaxID=109957 RepID=A0AAD5XEC6_9FUNG|nr:Tuberous sclerosis 2-like protein [Physocladia obscura]